jgi:hypothetical protein
VLRVSIVAGALALLVLPSATHASAEEPVLALVSQGTTSELVRLDPRSLAPVEGTTRVPLGLQDIPWAMSPDGSALALGSGRSTSLVFVDLRSLRRTGRIATAFTTALAWPTPDRLVLLERRPRRWWFALVDPTARVVVSRTPIGRRWYVAAAAITRDGLAILAAPEHRIGPPRLLVLEANGRARRVTLRGIDAGQRRKRLADDRYRLWYRNPGLAVDPEQGRAYVVTAGTRVAEIDLVTLAVAYREVRTLRARSHGSGSSGLASAGRSGGNVLSTGTQRQAYWLGNGAIASAGWDERLVRGQAGEASQHDAAAGLTLTDTRRRTARRLSAEARWFHTTADSIVAQVPPSRRPGTALVGFAHEGGERFRIELDRVWAGVQSAGTYVYLGLGAEYRPHAVAVVDARTGELIATPEAPGWVLLLMPSQPQFCWCYTGTTVG